MIVIVIVLMMMIEIFKIVDIIVVTLKATSLAIMKPLFRILLNSVVKILTVYVKSKHPKLDKSKIEVANILKNRFSWNMKPCSSNHYSVGATEDSTGEAINV